MPEGDSADAACVRFALSAAEYRAAGRRLSWELRPFKAMAATFVLIFLVGLGVTVAGNPIVGLAFIVASGVWSSVLALAVFVKPAVQYGRQPRLRADQSLCFNDDEIRAPRTDAESRMKWTFYEQVIETRDLYLLRFMRRVCNIVPKRAFTNPGDEARFRQLVRQLLKSSLREADR